jgi:hypothetical protein
MDFLPGVIRPRRGDQLTGSLGSMTRIRTAVRSSSSPVTVVTQSPGLTSGAASGASTQPLVHPLGATPSARLTERPAWRG